MSVVTMKSLLEAGVHFGHQKRRWDPRMKPFIYTERNDIYIIDLQKTLGLIEDAYTFIEDTAARGGTILFVGTKRQAQQAVQDAAEASNMPYVNNRWLGGTLTNFETVASRIKRLEELERMETEGDMARLSKKEALLLNREKEKLITNLGGIRHMKKTPEALFVVDPKNEKIATREALRLKVPIVAIVDTNCNPDEVNYIIPGNDDAIRSISLITQVMGQAAAVGHEKWSKAAAAEQAVKEKEEAQAKKAAEETAKKEKEAAEKKRAEIKEAEKITIAKKVESKKDKETKEEKTEKPKAKSVKTKATKEKADKEEKEDKTK